MSQLSIEDHVLRHHAVMDAGSKRTARELLKKRIDELSRLIEDMQTAGDLEDYVEMFGKDLNYLKKAYELCGGEK
jgi:phage tail tape-measure protein